MDDDTLFALIMFGCGLGIGMAVTALAVAFGLLTR